jgi:hypothetical protein
MTLCPDWAWLQPDVKKKTFFSVQNQLQTPNESRKVYFLLLFPPSFSQLTKHNSRRPEKFHSVHCSNEAGSEQEQETISCFTDPRLCSENWLYVCVCSTRR